MIMQYQGQMLQVVKREPGDTTGEERIQTSDGTIWTTTKYLPKKGTGDRQGVLLYDKVVES